MVWVAEWVGSVEERVGVGWDGVEWLLGGVVGLGWVR